MGGEPSEPRLLLRTCGKHGCTQPAVARARVVSTLQRTQHLSCAEHAEEFAHYLGLILKLDQQGEWRISLESLNWSGRITNTTTRPSSR